MFGDRNRAPQARQVLLHRLGREHGDTVCSWFVLIDSRPLALSQSPVFSIEIASELSGLIARHRWRRGETGRSIIGEALLRRRRLSIPPNAAHAARTAVTSTSTLNSGRVKPETITSVDAKALPAT